MRVELLIRTTMRIKTVGFRELQRHLGSHISELRQGDTLVITKRGKPLARVVLVDLPDTSIDERMQLLVAAGLVSWNGLKPSAESPGIPVRGAKTVAELLIEDRD